ncbi:tubulin-specific chaperone E [Daktulosphaira vitifoliae]|uniref:tubulin-specific chaperone E n=1 Tax=Daktulosphaira vitifoliae TaxID=58002 RepID=UPI0021AAA78E|nr:tubulin-specific chaperone E [Daktulosphaira vitifoliae]
MSDVCNDNSIKVGRRVLVDTSYGVTRYIGKLPGNEKIWVGIEWDDPLRGKHDGIHNSIRYFKTIHPNGASFVKVEKVIPCQVTFLQAFKFKYGQNCDPVINDDICAIRKQSKMSLFEVVGMQKIQEKQAHFDKLTYVNLNNESITDAGSYGEIQDCCPNISDLELCNNCFSNWITIAQIAKQLVNLTNLNLSFNNIKIPSNFENLKDCFGNLKKIILGNLNYSWNDVMSLCQVFPLLVELEVPQNNIDKLKITSHIINNLVTLNLENNQLSWPEINKLHSLKNLECLNLNRNKIDVIQIQPSTFSSLKFLMISHNMISSMDSINELNKLKSLISLRIQNNPLLKDLTVTNYTLQIVSRISTLMILNGTSITMQERKHFERDFLKDIEVIWHKTLTNDEEKKEFLLKYPRYTELIEKYGTYYIDNTESTNKIKTIKVKLVNYCKTSNKEINIKTKTLPVTMTMYRLKELSKRIFNLGNKNLELTYSVEKNPGTEYSMENMSQSLDYYSVENNSIIFVKTLNAEN